LNRKVYKKTFKKKKSQNSVKLINKIYPSQKKQQAANPHIISTIPNNPKKRQLAPLTKGELFKRQMFLGSYFINWLGSNLIDRKKIIQNQKALLFCNGSWYYIARY
jgi:hypothetical protein